MEDWIENKGKLDDLQGPDPTELAEKQIKGIERLRKFLIKFARKYLLDENRPFVIGTVGHSWNFGALAIYLANNGEVNLEGFKKVGGELIRETESVKVKLVEGRGVLYYKGKEYPIEL